MADQKQVEILKQGAAVWNEWREVNANAIIDLRHADLSNSNLSGANLRQANLYWANLAGTNLQKADLYLATVREASLEGADLTGASLECSHFVEANVEGATLKNCSVYGISCWDLTGRPETQEGLFVTTRTEGAITVNDPQIAQFIHLLLKNENVRRMLDAVTTKVVLILGRFSKERKTILDLLRQELSKYDYVPILFDFANTENQSLLETVTTLAGMACFVLADVTDATMAREELRSIVEKFPSKPIQPILLKGEKEYVSLPEMRAAFKSILSTYEYRNSDEIVSAFHTNIIAPAERWLEERKFHLANKGKSQREVELEKQIEALQKLVAEKAS